MSEYRQNSLIEICVFWMVFFLGGGGGVSVGVQVIESLSFASVIRQTANAMQRNILRYQAIKSKWTCCFKTEIHNYSFDATKRIWNENVQRKFCQESSNLPFPETWSLNSLMTFAIREKNLLSCVMMWGCSCHVRYRKWYFLPSI
jgi:hypothetical protein